VALTMQLFCSSSSKAWATNSLFARADFWLGLIDLLGGMHSGSLYPTIYYPLGWAQRVLPGTDTCYKSPFDLCQLGYFPISNR